MRRSGGLMAGERERREIGLRIWDLRGDSVGPKPREFSLEASSAHSNRIAGGKFLPEASITAGPIWLKGAPGEWEEVPSGPSVEWIANLLSDDGLENTPPRSPAAGSFNPEQVRNNPLAFQRVAFSFGPPFNISDKIS